MDRIKRRVFEILTDPPEGDRFGMAVFSAIMILIALNVVVAVLETVHTINAQFGWAFHYFDVFSVAVFTLEYIARLWACTAIDTYRGAFRGRLRLITRPIYIVDVLAIAPLYMQTVLPGLDLRFIRVLRLFRLVRLFRIGHLTESFETFSSVVRNRRSELSISFVIVLVSSLFASYVMFLVEHEAQPEVFSSVPKAMWWAIMTITTIGYGDVYPITVMGQMIGSIVALLGLCVLALPIAIIGAGFVNETQKRQRMERGERRERAHICPHCGKQIEVGLH